MKKKLTIALSGALAVGLAAPALAETTFSGFLYISPMVANEVATVDGIATFNTDEVDAVRVVDQRMRFTMTNKINDFASVVWQTETDTVWGDANAPINTDKVILETKHLYLTTKIPDSGFGLMLGQIPVADKIGGLYMGNDVSAAALTYNMDALSLLLAAAKANVDDEVYFLQAGYKVSDALSVNADVWQMVDDNDAAADTNYITAGVGVKAAVAMVNLDAAVAFQSGETASGMIANVGAKAAIDNINVGGRFVYIADDDKGEQWKTFHETPLAGEGLYYMTFSGGANKLAGKVAVIDGVSGAGLMGLMLNASVPVDAYTIRPAIGYFQLGDEGDNDALGTEIALTVSRKLAEKIDVSLFASYVMLGDAFDGAAADVEGDDPDNPMAFGLRFNAPF